MKDLPKIGEVWRHYYDKKRTILVVSIDASGSTVLMLTGGDVGGTTWNEGTTRSFVRLPSWYERVL